MIVAGKTSWQTDIIRVSTGPLDVWWYDDLFLEVGCLKACLTSSTLKANKLAVFAFQSKSVWSQVCKSFHTLFLHSNNNFTVWNSYTANVITEISAHSDRQSQHSLKIEGKSWSGFLLPTNSNFVMSLLEMHTKSRARSLFVHIKASGLEKF